MVEFISDQLGAYAEEISKGVKLLEGCGWSAHEAIEIIKIAAEAQHTDSIWKIYQLLENDYAQLLNDITASLNMLAEK